MINPNELEVQLQAAISQPPELTVEDAIAVYMAAKAGSDAFAKVADAAKQLISDVMAETGQTTYATRAGKVSIASPSTIVGYDAKAIDILLRDDADLAIRLAPYRKETMRAGTMRITGNK